jgi:hypothetical protein
MNENQEVQLKEAESQRDLRKFAVFLAVIFALILVMAVITEPLGERIVPAILGLDDDADISPDSALPDPGETSSFTSSESQVLMPLLDLRDSPELKDAIQYEVQHGETIYQIAVQFGVSVEDIASINRLVSPDQIEEGDVLIIPIME